jgi:hypothetical protein
MQTGAVVNLASGGDLQSAINAAQCGDTIQLPAGSVFAGHYTLPARSCDDAHWIMIRTMSPDSALPPPGTRLTPCYAGVTSLPGRPSFSCSSTAVVTAQITTNDDIAPIKIAAGASHYWLFGLEITRPPNGVSLPGGLIYAASSTATFDHIVLDRVWVHGTAQDETGRGFGTSGGTNIAVIDSFFTDFHCISISGTCTDAQAISGGTGDNPSGPIKILHNFLEASGENILFGGGEANQPPTDIEIRFNHLFKPLIWKSGQPGFVGGANGNPFIVKNLFELKNAQRVLYEGNVAENVWSGFSQEGYSVLLTPKNQNNLCPLCVVLDVTIRYSTFSHMAGGMQTGNGRSDSGGVPADGQRWSIHDITMDDIDPQVYNNGGGGYLFLVGQCDTCPSLKHVLVDHITAFPVFGWMTLNASPPPIDDYKITNSIITAGNNQLFADTAPSSCITVPNSSAKAILDACFNPYSVTLNAWIGGHGTYPDGKLFPVDANAVQFTNYNNGNGGDYTLVPTSPYKNAGLDGKDLGADIATVSQLTATAR